MLRFLCTWGMRREWLAHKAPEGPLKEYYKSPCTNPKVDYREAEYVALDLETTGLNAKEHEIVSIGWVVIRNQRLVMEGAAHQLVSPSSGLTDDSAAIHGITHDELEKAPSLEAGLARVLPILAGRVLVAHHAKIEWKFLNAACRKVYGASFEIPTVDTMHLEQKAFRRRNQEAKRGDLRLDKVRQAYNLPRYRAHNALIDAIACGELFLAQAAKRSMGKRKPLKDFMI
ncbi:exonuclease domain-containing protein [Magnetospira sp. QH-2]|uniref:exonuclease domain-containing protein n=1 Tax=Magnetospira sp. (strain QH-2) TaxID=1288970 RepID=UPI0003E80D0D|nr:exonuclease domain-containing protein [Magnetospira sp. QH-2]CCQ72682.1 Putative Exonuclease [Magnetospira sp. QH-2]